MRRIALQGFLVITLFVTLTAAGTAIASPQPRPVCGTCGTSFERVAGDQGIPVNVTESTATVYAHENGSATWVVTNRLEQPAESPAALEDVSRTAATAGRGLPDANGEESITFVTTSVEGGNVTLRFREEGAFERRLGLTVVDALHSDGVRGGWILNADRFAIVGPSGTEVVNDPGETIGRDDPDSDGIPEVDGRRVTWHGSVTERYGSVFHEDLYVVFGPSETSERRVDGAVALATAPIWFGNVQSFVVPGLAVYGLLLVGVAAATSVAGRGGTNRFGGIVAGLGLVGVAVSFVAQFVDEPAWFGSLAAVYLVTGVVARRRPDQLRSIQGALRVAVLSVFAAALVIHGHSLLGGPAGWEAVRSLERAVYHLPIAIAPAFGLAVARTREHKSPWEAVGAFGGAASTFLLAGMVFVPVATRPHGLVIIATVGGAILAAALSLPLAVLAARVWSSSHVDGTVDPRPGSDD